MNPYILFAYEHLLILFSIAIWLLLWRRWKVPVMILRYVGNKQRPTVIPTKARFYGNTGLIVKGYKGVMKNFDAEHYYPSLKGRGALVLWEFKPGWLVPTIPYKQLKKLSKEEQVRVEAGLLVLRERGIVGFEYDQDKYESMMLKSVDNVDAEYFLNELERQKTQYTGGWKDFLTQNSGWISLVILGALFLVGFIIYLDKAPDVAGQCIEAGVEAAKNTYLRSLAGNLSSGGSLPLG